MGELEDKINSILSNPAELEQISRLAGRLMGGDGAEAAEASGAGAPDGELLGRLAKLAGSAVGQGSDKSGLLKALTPYLRPERSAKLQKAMRLAQMARLAGVALEKYGGEKGV